MQFCARASVQLHVFGTMSVFSHLFSYVSLHLCKNVLGHLMHYVSVHQWISGSFLSNSLSICLLCHETQYIWAYVPGHLFNLLPMWLYSCNPVDLFISPIVYIDSYNYISWKQLLQPNLSMPTKVFFNCLYLY